MEDNGLEPMTFWLPGTRCLIQLQCLPVLKNKGKRVKTFVFPPQTTLLFSIISYQKHAGITHISQNNPYFFARFCRKIHPKSIQILTAIFDWQNADIIYVIDFFGGDDVITVNYVFWRRF